MNTRGMKVYAVKHKDENVVQNSRSGGIFTALSDLFIDKGKIYGCILNNELKVVHIGSSNEDDRNKMRGSKYVQSNVGNCFRDIKNDLLENKFVLFSGTSCQVAGLRSFLKKEYPNLLCVDIVCHGVTSPLLFENYLNYFGKVTNIEFRNKKDFGWRDHTETLLLKDKKIDSKIWTNIFYSGNALRPSCYKCPFKSIYHPGDITIGDYWGIENVAPEFDDNKGVSIVMVNTPKGACWFEKTKCKIHWKETRIENSMQRAFERSENCPKGRDRFWEDFRKRNFSFIASQYNEKKSPIRRLCMKLKKLFCKKRKWM